MAGQAGQITESVTLQGSNVKACRHTYTHKQQEAIAQRFGNIQRLYPKSLLIYYTVNLLSAILFVCLNAV